MTPVPEPSSATESADGGRGSAPAETETRPVREPDPAWRAKAPRDEQEALERLLAVLDLSPAADEDADVFVGQSQPQPWGRVYGGQVLAQSLVAAQRTVDPDRPVHSLHGYFLRAGNSNEPITFAVERLRDGRSFSARRTHAIQFGRPILSMIVSFQEPADGPDHQVPMPDAPPPESLPTVAERYAGVADGSYWVRERPIDLRHVDEPLYVAPSARPSTRQMLWMKAVGTLPDDPALHAAVLAYASDYSMLEPVLRAHGLAFTHPGLKMASLDHAMWWHRPARADEWLLATQESPTAQGARGLGLGRIFTRDGALACSVAQEGMIRVPAR